MRLQQFLDDDAFTRLQSPLAQNADKTATELAQWCRNSKNQLFLQLFAADLLQLFEKVIKTVNLQQITTKEPREYLESFPPASKFKIIWMQVGTILENINHPSATLSNILPVC